MATVGVGPSGGISKSNLSSLDNPLAHPNLEYYKKPQAQQIYYPQSAQSAKESLGGQFVNPNDYYNDNNQNLEYKSEYSLDAYKKVPENNTNFQENSFQASYQDMYQQSDNYQQFNNQANNLQNYLKRETESIQDFNNYASNKQAYRRALDQQVAEKEILKQNMEKIKIKNEADYLNGYPFGRSNTNSNQNHLNQVSGYQPSFSNNNNNNNNNNYKPYIEEPHLRFNKDNIIEKPNSLVADVPFYDPVKHRTGYHQGYNYDPWGKPGSGAPLIDSSGRKFTKYTGQVWYDTLGLTFDDRSKFYQDKNRPLTLDEQRSEMEAERQRRRTEEVNYKGRTGDLATWITDLENKRVNKIINQGAHLNHTNVTREKINLEYARKNNVNLGTKQYHDELGAQLEERNRMNKLYKLKDDVAGIEHTKKWDDWWGKPGGGAPNPDLRRRDLKDTLESPRDARLNNFEGVSLPVGSSSSYKNSNDPLLYAKGTVKSNHRNMYDNLQPMKL